MKDSLFKKNISLVLLSALTFSFFFTGRAYAWELGPTVGMVSISSSDSAVGIGGKLRFSIFELGGVSSGVKTDAYLLETHLVSVMGRYTINKYFSGAAGFSGWQNYVGYRPQGGDLSGYKFRMWGPSFQIAFRFWKRAEIGVDYAFGVPSRMVFLNTWAPKGFLYGGIFF